jgi:hypothetical protein
MSYPRSAIGYERRRQVQIRVAFEAGLARRDREGFKSTGFFLACAAYLVVSMDRLHFQDQVIHDLLKERISSEEVEVHRKLSELNDRQEKSRELVDEFHLAAEALTETGPAGRRAFERVANEFVSAFSSLMAARKNPFEQYTAELFTDDDWTVIAAVTDESRAVESELFAAVKANAPVDIDPDTISIVYH